MELPSYHVGVVASRFIPSILSPLFQVLPLPAAFLVLLSLDMAFLTYVVMPRYSRLMNFWLKPGEGFTWFHELTGWAILLGIIGVTLFVFLAFGHFA